MAFTRALGKGVCSRWPPRVVAINPGPVETDRLVMLRRAEAQAKLRRPRALARTGRRTWRSAVPAMPAEIANAVAFLASPLSGYTTGTVLTINGGGG